MRKLNKLMPYLLTQYTALSLTLAVASGLFCCMNTSAENKTVANDLCLQSVRASQRWHEWRKTRKEFPLAAWSYFSRYAGTRKEYQIYRDAGLNMVQAPLAQAENARTAGVGLVLGAFRNVHQNEEELAALVAYANQSPQGAVAYSLKDEPEPEDYPALGKAMAYIYANDISGALPIIDFRPNWAVPKRWNMTYESCVERFIEEVAPPVLINCHYPLKRDGTTRNSYYANIELFRRLALKRDIGLMGFIQLTAHTFKNCIEIDYRTPSESDLNWMINTYLAYGAQGLWYYNWRINDKRFEEGLVDGESGRPTAIYPMVQKVNARVNALSDTLLKLKSTRVAHTDEVVPAGTMRYAPGVITGIHAFKGDSFIVSEFFNQDDLSDKAVYLMIVNKMHAADKNSDQLKHSCSFRIYPDYPDVMHFDTDKLKFENLHSSSGLCSLNLGGGESALMILNSVPTRGGTGSDPAK